MSVTKETIPLDKTDIEKRDATEPKLADDKNKRREEVEKEEEEGKTVNPEDLIDTNTFDQLLDMDDQEDHEFSYSIVINYFEQAQATFKDMDAALDRKDLPELSRLGHFLKGSSAAIGLKKVKATCEKIQHIGNCKDEVGIRQMQEDEALNKITQILPRVKAENSEAEEYLRNFYKHEAR